MSLLPVLTPAQCADWDERTDGQGTPRALLMESAGRAAAAVLGDTHGPVLRRGVLVLCGPGNNGGDGWVLARALHHAGVPVWVAPAAAPATPLASAAAARARADGVREVEPVGPWPSVGLVVDALLGTGAVGAPRPAIADLLDRQHQLAVPLVALDGPTGLDLGSGATHGSPRADLTITFGAPRRGHLLGRESTGRLVVVDIGHAPPDPAWPRLLDDVTATGWLPALAARDHKGTRGRLAIVGGSPGMSGAPRLAARAALASGAGGVHLVTSAASHAMLAAAEPELQVHAAPSDAPPEAWLVELLTSMDAVVVGPGLGRGVASRGFVGGILAAARAAVVDADALMAFAGDLDALATACLGKPVLLTPHPGEFRALAPGMSAHLEVDPWGAAEAAAARLNGGAVLLKGVPTVVAAHGGASLTVAAGNPGLATGGSGDTLSGIAAACLAAGLDPVRAGAVAAQALGSAADIGARRVTARALTPVDVTAALPDVWRAWDARHRVPPPPRPPVLLDLPAPVLA